MSEVQRIPGGYYLKARCIKDNEIAHAPPHAREIFDYFLRNAFWKDGGQLKRGQLLTSYKAIQDDLRWYIGNRPMRYKKHQIETAVKLIARTGAVTTAKTTRGMIVTVCNYCRFQDPDNYENHSETYAKQKRDLRESHTIDEEGKKEEGKNSSICPEPDKPGSVPDEVVLSFPVRAGKEWGLLQSKFNEYTAAFPALGAAGVTEEIKAARQWLIDRPKQRKTAAGMPRFLSGWLGRAVKKDGGWGFKNAAHFADEEQRRERLRARLKDRPADEQESQVERLKREAVERLRARRQAALAGNGG